MDGPREAPALRMDVLVDSVRRIPMRYGEPRPVIAYYQTDVSLTDVGFSGTSSTADLAPGRHRLEIEVVERDFKRPVAADDRLSFTVARS